jgi:tripartite-type tricarboxylate transporter receptor subunit TctC
MAARATSDNVHTAVDLWLRIRIPPVHALPRAQQNFIASRERHKSGSRGVLSGQLRSYRILHFHDSRPRRRGTPTSAGTIDMRTASPGESKSFIIGIAFVCFVFGAAGSAPAAVSADAQYPRKPIRIIDPFPPGGATDFLDRIVAQKLSERFGQPVIVDNRPGAGGNLSAELCARATPDGYTLHMNLPGGMAAGRVLYPGLAYDISKDFAYITLVAAGTYVLVAHPTVPAKSVSELVALAKAKPGELRYGSSGVASPPHLAFELLKLRTGTRILHVPYKGAGPLVAGLTGGEVQLGFASPAGASALVKAGRLNALGVSSARRAKSLPAVPTIAESGFPDFDVTPSYGYMAPAGVPQQIVSRLNAEIGKILGMPDVQAAFLTQGLEAAPSTPQRMRQTMHEELERWTRVIREANITAQ